MYQNTFYFASLFSMLCIFKFCNAVTPTAIASISSSGSGVFYSNLNFLKNDWNIRYYIGEFYYDADSEYNKEECEENGAIYRAENYGTLLQYACIVNSAIEHVWKKQ